MFRSYLFLACVMLAGTRGFSTNCFKSVDDPIIITVDSIRHPNCLNALGYIAVAASGGNPAYTFEWSNGATGAILNGLVAGDYTVVVTDQDGLTLDLKITLEDDFDAPIADAGAPQTVNCSNTSISLNGTGSSGPGFTVQWVASNGGRILSGANTLTPVIDLAGTFQLTVTDVSNGCTVTDLTTVTALHPAPAASATGGVVNCTFPSINLAVTYTILNTTFLWQGPAGFTSKLVNPSVNTAGNYVFTVTDTLTGCTNKSTAIVTTNLTAPNADAAGGGVISCAQPSVQLTGSSTTLGALYTWTGPNGFLSADQNPTVTSPGNYTLTVRNPANGCTATDGISVTSNLTAPTASAFANGTLTCAVLMVQLNGMSNTQGVSYAWTGPNNFQSGVQNPMASMPGLYFLTVKNPANGCTGSANVMVIQNIAVPNASATGGIKTCSAPSVTLKGSSTTPNVTYSWTGPGNFVSMQQNPSVSTSGTYTVKVTNPQNGCTATATANVSQNTTPPSVSATSTTFTCINPLAQITTTSSPQGLNYSWTGPNNFTSALQNPKVGVEGYYNVTVTNPGNGCTNSTTLFVYGNNTPPFAYAGEDRSLNCVFSNLLLNGSFSSSGPNFTYLWTTDDGHIISGSNLQYSSIDAPGTYMLLVTNTQSGCTDTDDVYITQSTPVTATITQNTPVHCSGGANGTAKVVGGGGSSDYTYRWSNGKLTPTINGLSAGVYTVTVTDTEGCSKTASTTINQLTLTAAINVTHQTIPGVNNGTATAIGIGGTDPYTAKWSNGGMTLTITNLAPGPYSVTLTDANGCTLVTTTNINAANCILNGTVSGTNLLCSGANNGTATVNLNNSLNPVTYIWSNGGTTKTISGLAPGTYSVTATDGSACKVVQLVQITAPAPLVTTIAAQTNVLCPNASDGTITAGVTGGTQPYTYLWSNNRTSAAISGLTAGTYTLTVTDKNGCSSTVSAQINGPSPITITILQKTDVDCPGANTGSVSISAVGGLPPYNYFWSNSSSQTSISGLTPGNYTLTITDANNCPKSLSTEILVADQAPPTLILKNATVELDLNGFAPVSANQFDNGSFDQCGIASWTITPNTFNCNQLGQNNVTITATDLGGHTSTGTAVVTVVDNILPNLVCPANINTGSCNAVLQFNMPQIMDNCQVNPAQLSQISGLASGSTFPAGTTHQVFQYTDLAGNKGQCNFQVFVGESVAISVNQTTASCSGACDGTATLTQLSGGNFSLAWSNGQVSPNLTGLCPGTYTVTVTDVYNCVQTRSTEIAVNDATPPQLSCPINIVGSFCAPQISYAAPVVTDNCIVIGANIQQIAGLPSGALFPVGNTVQTFRYTDGGGNTGQCSFTINISGPPIQTVDIDPVSCTNLCNGSAVLSVSGGNGPFSIQWSNGQTGPLANNLCAANYTYMVIDAAGCTQMGSVTISQPMPLFIAVDQVQNDPGSAGNGSILVSISGGTGPFNYSWTRNGQFYAGTEDLSNLFPGQYMLVITDANGCSVNSALLTVTNTVATNAPAWTQHILLSPNPANERIQLDFGSPLSQSAELRLVDLNGQIALYQNVEANTQQVFFDISNVPAGIWMVQISLEDGQKTVRKLVVVQ